MTLEYRKRLKRFNEPNHAHVLTFSCYRRYPLLLKDRTRRWLVEALDQARSKHNYAILAYVIMPEHAHVLVYPRKEQYDIADFLKSVKQSVSRKAKGYLLSNSPTWLQMLSVNTRRGRVFRFWQAGAGYDRNIRTTELLRKEIEYICNNPVRRRLACQPTEWTWSSASFNLEGKQGVLSIDTLGKPPH